MLTGRTGEMSTRVLYYTGTGNSGYVAGRIANKLGVSAENLFERLRDDDTSPVTGADRLVFVTPTYAWRIPAIVSDWMRRVTFDSNAGMYFVLTCGSGIGAAGKYAMKLASECGLTYKGIAKVVMPENYIAMFNAPNEAEALKIIGRAEPVIDGIADRIAADEEFSVKSGLFGAFESGPVNKGFYAGAIKDRAFTVSEKCVGCGLCAAGCVKNNIVMENDKPVWQGNCTHCMACICYCPKEAIEYGNASAGKPRYKCPL